MSKRAESAELKYYGALYSDQMKNERKGFIKGYEQAEKDTIERCVAWLKEHAEEYNSSESAFDHMEEEMITDFRKAMEEE